jgi:hypothetical protein
MAYLAKIVDTRTEENTRQLSHGNDSYNDDEDIGYSWRRDGVSSYGFDLRFIQKQQKH